MLILKNITKTYPGVVALDDVSLSFRKGEIHALMGENGAGKSTLIKCVAGAITPDCGTIEVKGSSFPKLTPSLAKEQGIAVIYQDINLVTPMSVAENIFLGRRVGKLHSQRTLRQMAQKIFDEYGIDLDPDAPVMTLSPANQQMVEICKAISNDAELMIMDEPTATLANNEVDVLFRIIRKLKADGVTIIYISHRIDEVFELSDRISILRDGKSIATVNTADTSRDELISYMVGRKLESTYPERSYVPGEVVLKAENLTGNSVENISFELHRGEILGFAGLVGSGRTETAELIAGSKRITSGDVYVNGEKVTLGSPRAAIAHGIGLIPEDRKHDGVIMHSSVMFNETLICAPQYCKNGVINKKKRIEIAERFRKALRIKVPDINQSVGNLSGGNQQKVVVAKTLAADLDIIFFDEPTKGIDVGAKQEIYQLMNEMTEQGKSIIMISSDMEEILGMSDRIVVLFEGCISGELTRDEFSQERVLRLASGLGKEAE